MAVVWGGGARKLYILQYTCPWKVRYRFFIQTQKTSKAILVRRQCKQNWLNVKFLNSYLPDRKNLPPLKYHWKIVSTWHVNFRGPFRTDYRQFAGFRKSSENLRIGRIFPEPCLAEKPLVNHNFRPWYLIFLTEELTIPCNEQNPSVEQRKESHINLTRDSLWIIDLYNKSKLKLWNLKS